MSETSGGARRVPGLGNNRLQTGFQAAPATPTKRPRSMGGFIVEGDSDDEATTPARVRIDCEPCMKAIKYRGRVDCVHKKGDSCTSCQASRRVCARETSLFASNPGLRRAYKIYKELANEENPVPFVKKGRGVKQKAFSEAVCPQLDPGPQAAY
jgi:hypothetical protein